jgi:hypothetical protein
VVQSQYKVQGCIRKVKGVTGCDQVVKTSAKPRLETFDLPFVVLVLHLRRTRTVPWASGSSLMVLVRSSSLPAEIWIVAAW